MALAERVRRDERLEGLRAAIADYEDEFGEITALGRGVAGATAVDGQV